MRADFGSGSRLGEAHPKSGVRSRAKPLELSPGEGPSNLPLGVGLRLSQGMSGRRGWTGVSLCVDAARSDVATNTSVMPDRPLKPSLVRMDWTSQAVAARLEVLRADGGLGSGDSCECDAAYVLCSPSRWRAVERTFSPVFMGTLSESG